MSLTLPPAPAGAIRYAELESLRGIAALLVVLFHIPAWNSQLHELAIIRNGALMVQLFFVLSGFVIYTAYGQKLNDLNAVLKFQFLRLGRLYPVHLFMLGAFTLMEFAKYPLAQLGYNLGDPFAFNTWHAFFQQLLLWQCIGPDNSGFTFNGPAWSISVEFYTYLIFALVVWLAPRGKLWLSAVLAVGAMAAMVFGWLHGYINLIWCIAGFFLGCLVSALVQARRFTLPAITPWLAFAALLAFLQFNHQVRNDVAIFPLSALLILGIVCGQPGAFQRILRWRPLQWLGELSYAIYMIHAFILDFFLRGLFFGLNDRVSDVDNLPHLDMAEALLVYAAFIGITLLAAQGLHRYIENPWRERSRRFAQGRALGLTWLALLALFGIVQFLNR
ncbi:acyltransferase family protein [Amantichitinum ursilacus]|uniref:Acyltransferase family protein n=1 Tax=Amantichitinum ursilacus TaxID=857265 RepID=A0A0N0GM03_9NEIS|nr:acyltransferase [Amantichitinum ursilacus]KPC50457.1 Acyltransferase family protein [Amantichitinum ursilacus]